jgi:tetratricopeptide (TPR) repeat protein
VKKTGSKGSRKKRGVRSEAMATNALAIEDKPGSFALSIILYTALVLCTAAVFLQTVRFGFVDWDDFYLVVRNPDLIQPTWEGVKGFWTTPSFGLYTPMPFTVWAMLSKLAGENNPGLLHELNILLHIVSATLVFSILRKILRSDIPAFLGSLLFAIHPLQVEPVAWIAGMNNVLAGMLSLAAIRFYLQFLESQMRNRWWWHAAATFLFLLSLFSKPTAVVTPVIALALAWWRWPGAVRRVLLPLAPWALLAVIFACVARAVQPTSSIMSPPIWQRPAVTISSVFFYLEKTFWPARLNMDYGLTPRLILQSQQWIGEGAYLLGAAVILWFNRSSVQGVAMGLLLMLLALSPVLGLTPFDYQKYSTVADRYMYLAMLGPALALAWSLTKIEGPAPRVIAGALVLALAVVSALRVPVWRDGPTLVKRTLEADPDNAAANDLAGYQFGHAADWPRAAQCYERALRSNGEDGDLHYNYANALQHCNHIDDAIAEYKKALQLPPGLMRERTIYYLGVVYLGKGELDLAEHLFNEVLQLQTPAAQALWPGARQKLNIIAADRRPAR